MRGGQLNRAYRVDGEYVIRCRDGARCTGSLTREAYVLRRIRGKIPAPEILASGLDDLLGEYVIQKWLPGVNLLDAWLANPDANTREWWLMQWVAAIRTLHQERFERPGEIQGEEIREAVSWRRYVEGRIRKRCDELIRTPCADRDIVLAAERFARRLFPTLEDGPFCLIHRDMHFGNVLVDGPHLSGVLDFELAEIGPPDYELDSIVRFLRSPELYVSGDAAPSPTRFASVWVRLKRGYPELFQVRHLQERLRLYALDRELSSLLQVYRLGWNNELAVKGILGRLREILAGNYGLPV